MKGLTIAAVAAVGFVATSGLRADGVPASHWKWNDLPFSGVWVVEPELTTFDLRLPELSIDKGVFRRTDCQTGPLEIPADGSSHEVKGQIFFDTAAVRVTDRHRAELTESLTSKTVWRGKYTVSNDARSMTLEFEDRRADNPVSGLLEFARDDSSPNNAQPLSGTWRPRKLIRLTDSELTLDLGLDSTEAVVSADGPSESVTFRLAQSDGRRAEGKLDAHEYPLSGYLPKATISINRLRPNLLQINRSQGGRLVEMSRVLVSEDGQSLTLSQIDVLCQAKTTFTLARKQVK